MIENQLPPPPFVQGTLNDALDLGRLLIHGPGYFPPETPLPTPDEALKAVEDALERHKFNWITGQTARDILRREVCKNDVWAAGKPRKLGNFSLGSETLKRNGFKLYNVKYTCFRKCAPAASCQRAGVSIDFYAQRPGTALAAIEQAIRDGFAVDPTVFHGKWYDDATNHWADMEL